MAIAMNLDTHFELRQSGFSTATLSRFYAMRLRTVYDLMTGRFI
jgi:hypothetical protein